MSSASSAISLKGSADIVAEFFGYAINSILYQRGVYAPEQFERQKKYGLTLLVTAEDKLKAYINQILTQLKARAHAQNGSLKRPCNKWSSSSAAPPHKKLSSKPEAEIHKEIQGIIRQVTASVTFLPLIDEPCVFEMIMYTDKHIDTPETMEESDPKHVKNAAEDFKLRSFTTDIHAIQSSVTYRDA
ncbi:uncharacterized protein MONBRDRAFT_27575 [Monosiga brevicollis MX1]|uniref:HORMA domain-containing protein n=1 Tax=Monosiga brevicollis TaxID=81824 RepID=A9V5P1_MONBE|nr:uncharacterized protein MONBRDRAFT_27575 [Monosiga brevicollis MX1]EDQ87152.1 predicted protein [Monosiga brevicollis MX1]|eukprot:XP_001748095.1 hypothetical protein [Monosiga brevicollis MX1]